MTPRETKIAAFLGGCCFFCSSLEYAIPKPLPFLRLGIANVPVMAAIDMLPLPAVCLVVILKVVGQALISGTLFSYVSILSAAGTCCSAAVMYLLYTALYRRALISWIGISIAGAAVSNIVQLSIAARCFMGGGVMYIMPVFLAVGTLTGTILGVICERYMRTSAFIAHVRTAAGGEMMDMCSSVKNQQKLSALFCAGCGMFVLFFAVSHAVNRISFFGLSGTAAEAAALLILSFLCLVCLRFAGRKAGIVPYVITVMCITLSNCVMPCGRVLLRIGAFAVTEQAFVQGIKRAASFECMIFISRMMISRELRLPGYAGAVLGASFAYFGRLSQLGSSVLHTGSRNAKKTNTQKIDTVLERVFFDSAATSE